MKSRMATMALAGAIILVISFNNLLAPFNNILDVFCWLTYFLVVTVIVLWPRTGKDGRDDGGRGNWADRIEFDSSKRTG